MSDELTPEIAQSLLDNDLANIIALVKAGQPLTKTQRQLLEEYARKKAATAPTATGSAAAPAPAATPGTAPAPESSFALVSDAPPLTLGDFPTPGDYQHPQKVYAERYGVSVRTIKLWIQKGKENDPPKPCPLDNPEALAAWWGEVMHNRAPALLLSLADHARRARVGAGTPTTQASEGSGAATPAAPQPQEAPPKPKPDEPLSTGFSATLDRVRIAEAKASVRYLEEFEKPEHLRDDSKTARLRREWSELSEQLGALEKAAPNVLGKSGEMLTRADILRILQRLHGPIVSGIRTLLNRVEAKTSPQTTLEAARPTFTAEVERLLAGLVTSEFAPAE